jgi:hypothetical protein
MRDLFGCHISQASVQRAGRFCSGKLIRTDQRIKASIRDSPVIGADETGLRGVPNGAAPLGFPCGSLEVTLGYMSHAPTS